MKIMVDRAEIEISDWSCKLKIATIIFAAITAISSIILLSTKVVIPGLVFLFQRSQSRWITSQDVDATSSWKLARQMGN